MNERDERNRKVYVTAVLAFTILLLGAVISAYLLRADGGGGGRRDGFGGGGGRGGAGEGHGQGVERGGGAGDRTTGTGAGAADAVAPTGATETAAAPAVPAAPVPPAEQPPGERLSTSNQWMLTTVVAPPAAPRPPAAAAGRGGREAGSGGGSGGGSGRGQGRGAGDGASAGETSFMGKKASGNSFVYIVDCSGSMRGTKLGETRGELLSSIAQLTRRQRFFVFFYNTETFAWPGAQEMRWATKENRDDCARWAAGLEGGGGTDPEDALLRALRLQPDVIFLMSDGLFRDSVCDRVRAARKGRPTVIHTISFVDPSGERVMRRLAEENGGAYTFNPGVRARDRARP